MMDIFDDYPAKPKKPQAKDFDGVFEPIAPFDQYSTPDLRADLLPPVLGNFARNIAEVLHVPVSMPVLASLGIVSVALSRKFEVSPKSDWVESINIYAQIAMQPASNKSQTLKFLKSPVDEWEKREIERITPEREKSLSEIKTKQIELNKFYKILSGSKSKQADIDKAREEIPKLESQLIKLKEDLPIIPQTYTTDVTAESLATLLDEQNGRVGIISDEGGVTEVLSGLYSNGSANIDILLKGIDGGVARIKRKDKDYNLRPYLTVLLLIQPQILSNMADKRAFTGNGALERYLYALPSGNVGYRTFTEATIDEYTQKLYDNLIINLLSIPVPENPHVLKLSDSAKAVFTDFRHEIERELRPDGKLYICRYWGGKLAGYTLRLAALMHVAEHENTSNLYIQKPVMENAISLARLLMEHAVAAYNMMGMDTETKDAKELLEWLKTQNVKYLTKSAIINAMRNRQMGKKERLAKALGVLTDRNMLSVPNEDKSTAKPTEVYFINPAIF